MAREFSAESASRQGARTPGQRTAPRPSPRSEPAAPDSAGSARTARNSGYSGWCGEPMSWAANSAGVQVFQLRIIWSFTCVDAEVRSHGDDRRHLAEVRRLYHHVEPQVADLAGPAAAGKKGEVLRQPPERPAATDELIGAGLGRVDRHGDERNPSGEVERFPGRRREEDAVCLDFEREARIGRAREALQDVAEVPAAEGIAARGHPHRPGLASQRQQDGIGHPVQPRRLGSTGGDDLGAAGRAGERATPVVGEDEPLGAAVEPDRPRLGVGPEPRVPDTPRSAATIRTTGARSACGCRSGSCRRGSRRGSPGPPASSRFPPRLWRFRFPIGTGSQAGQQKWTSPPGAVSSASKGARQKRPFRSSGARPSARRTSS